MLQKFQPLYFLRNRGPIGRVERQQRRALRIAGGTKILSGKRTGQIAPPVEGKIHHQKRHISRGVGETETLIKFNAINDGQVWR